MVVVVVFLFLFLIMMTMMMIIMMIFFVSIVIVRVLLSLVLLKLIRWLAAFIGLLTVRISRQTDPASVSASTDRQNQELPVCKTVNIAHYENITLFVQLLIMVQFLHLCVCVCVCVCVLSVHMLAFIMSG